VRKQQKMNNITVNMENLSDKERETFLCSHKCNDIYFSSEKIANNVIDAIGADRIRKYYFRAKD
jgi:hypothetical protein